MSLPSQFNNFLQVEFTDVAGIVMNGQTLSLDFVFEDTPYLETIAPVWAQLFLQTGPQNSDGDFPYSQYVVFEPGTTAHLLSENRERLETLMTDWNGGMTGAPAPTFPSLETDHGFAGADLLAYPAYGERVGGVHFEIVLPNTGQTIYTGRIGLQLETLYARVDRPANITSVPSSPDASPVTEQITPPTQVDPTDAAEIGFVFPDFGSQSVALRADDPFVSGYVRIDAKGVSSPSGATILEYRNNGVLISEAMVPDSLPVTNARVYVETKLNPTMNTSIVVANPNSEEAIVSFEFRNEQGDIHRMGSFTLTSAAVVCAPGSTCNNQLSRSLDEAPYFVGPDFQGTLTLSSSAPVSVFAMRWSLTGGAPGDILITPLPVTDLSISPTGAMPVVPLYSVGDYRKVELTLMNPTGMPLAGVLQFLDPWGGAGYVGYRGAYASNVEYYVAPNGSQKLEFANSPLGAAIGSVRVVPYNNTIAPVPFVINSYQEYGVGLFEIGVSSILGTAFRLPAEHIPEQTRTIITLANAANFGGTVWLSFTAPDGSPISSTNLYLPAAGQILESLEVMLPSISNQQREGVLRITTDLPSISAAGLRARYNGRGQWLYTTVVPVVENGNFGTGERFLPYFANGGPFSSEVVLFSGHPGGSSGTVQFIQPDGSPLYFSGP